MNDFTKEELLWLKKEVGVNIEYFPDIQIACDIFRKLKKMIDNYEGDKQVKESLNYILQKAREWKVEL